MGTFLTSCSSQSHKPLLRWEELGVARGGSNLATGYLVSPLGGYRHSYLVSPQGGYCLLGHLVPLAHHHRQVVLLGKLLEGGDVVLHHSSSLLRSQLPLESHSTLTT